MQYPAPYNGNNQHYIYQLQTIYPSQSQPIQTQPQAQYPNSKQMMNYQIERDIRQAVQWDLQAEYDKIIGECNNLLKTINLNMNNSLRKDSNNLYFNYNGMNIENKLDDTNEIEYELSKINSVKAVNIVKDIEKIVENTRNNTQVLYLPLFLIESLIEPMYIFDIYSDVKDGVGTYNLFTYTNNLAKRLVYKVKHNSLHKLFNERFLDALTKNDNSGYIKEWITYFYKTLRRVPEALILIGNKDVPQEMFYNGIIQQIFGSEYCITINDYILDIWSVADIVKNKLFIHIDHIPEDEVKQKKLKDLLEAMLVYANIGYVPNQIQFLCQIIITVDSPHPFFKEFLSASKVFFVDSMDNIKTKLDQEDRVSLLNNITKNLDDYSTKLASLEHAQLRSLNNTNITNQEVLNQRQIHFSNLVVVNDAVPFANVDYQTDNQLLKDYLANPELMRRALSLNSKHPTLDPFDDSFETIIPLEERFKHTYITGQTGSGKSELLKTLIKRDIENDNCSVILFDIHGDLADSVSKLVTDKERLIYIDPLLDEEKSPTINLFSTIDKSEKNIARMGKVILSILKDVNEDEAFSGSMEDVLTNCIPVILRKQNGSFEDLYRFMNDKANTDLIQQGIEKGTRFESEYFQDYFKEVIQETKTTQKVTSKLKSTKDAVRRRIRKLISDPLFYNLMNGEDKIDLAKQMNTKGKIIIFKIPKEEMQDTYVYYTRFLIGLIQITALKRKSIAIDKRCITHLYIDEFHNFITPAFKSILAESRKFNLFLTMAHQSISQIDNNKLVDIILSNTNVKIIGKNNNKTLLVMNKTLNTKLEDLEILEAGEFYIQYGNKDVLKICNTEELLNDKMVISPTLFEENKQYQLEQYYRDIIKVKTEAEKGEELNKSIYEFIEAIKTLDKDYFKILLDSDEKFFKNFNNEKDDSNEKIDDGADGYIAQSELSRYFKKLYPEFDDIVNKIFLKMLNAKDDFFNQVPNDDSKRFSQKRYKIILKNR